MAKRITSVGTIAPLRCAGQPKPITFYVWLAPLSHKRRCALSARATGVRSTMKVIPFFFLLLVFSMNSLATQEISFPSFNVSIPEKWVYEESEGVASIFSGDSVGVLQISGYKFPDNVTKKELFDLTGLEEKDRSQVEWQKWGEYSGYQLIYSEGDRFWRKWFLSNEKSLVFVTYNCELEDKDKNLEYINNIVDSLDAKET